MGLLFPSSSPPWCWFLLCFHSDLRASFTFSSNDLSKYPSVSGWIFSCSGVSNGSFLVLLSPQVIFKLCTVWIFCCTFLPQKRFLLALFWSDTVFVSMYLTGCIWCRPPCSHPFWSAYVSWRAGERWVWSSRGVLWLGATVGLRSVVQNCLFWVAELLLWLSSQICHVVFRWPSVMKGEETGCSLLLAKGTWRPHAFVFWCRHFNS